MTLTPILIFIALGLIYRLLPGNRWRGWFLFCASILAVYALQPASGVRYLDFWLPTLTLALAGLGWLLTTRKEERGGRENLLAGAALGGVVLLVALLRYLPLDVYLSPSRPPQALPVILVLLIAALLAYLLLRLRENRAVLWAAIGMLVALLLALKTPAVAQGLASGLRLLAGQSVERASALDLRWLGFSYIAFRLIHTFRDRQSGRLPGVTLHEYVTFIVFYPALAAGPIDRLERFVKDLCAPLQPHRDVILKAGERLAVGLLKKFVIADSLALIALNGQNAAQVQGAGWAWVLVYAYALQIFFDFAGYTDIAIGLGHLVGIRLPENFNAPYLKPNLTQFWNNWHMTLTQWFRAYYFNPISRSLRRKLSPPVMVLLMQVSTMTLIGLWHGVTWNFVLWGLWHGLGLFVQNRYSEWVKPKLVNLADRPRLLKTMNIFGVALTFHYVVLGWVFFALPSVGLAARVFGVLFGSVG